MNISRIPIIALFFSVTVLADGVTANDPIDSADQPKRPQHKSERLRTMKLLTPV